MAFLWAFLPATSTLCSPLYLKPYSSRTITTLIDVFVCYCSGFLHLCSDHGLRSPARMRPLGSQSRSNPLASGLMSTHLLYHILEACKYETSHFLVFCDDGFLGVSLIGVWLVCTIIRCGVWGKYAMFARLLVPIFKAATR